jgi:phosphatidyl-myo-inositol dimannoside synthase
LHQSASFVSFLASGRLSLTRSRTAIASAPACRILFLARRYPPHIGGIERHCYELHRRLADRHPVKLLALGRASLLHLAWFMPYIFVVAWFMAVFRRVDVIYFADGVAGSLAPFLRPFTSARFVVTIYGLELTYSNSAARGLMRRGAAACDRVVVISEATRRITQELGVPAAKLHLVYVGIEPLELDAVACDGLRQAFEQEHGLRFAQDRVLLNFGRLVPRKGVAAFLEKGMALLEEDIRLVIAGGGEDWDRIVGLRRDMGLEQRIILVAAPDDETIAMLRASADLFIFPNVPTPNNIEGFGMTHLESMYAGTPAVAFAVDAISESGREGAYLVEPDDYAAFAEAVHAYYRLDAEARQAKSREAGDYIRREYGWDKTAARYLDLFEGRL